MKLDIFNYKCLHHTYSLNVNINDEYMKAGMNAEEAEEAAENQEEVFEPAEEVSESVVEPEETVEESVITEETAEPVNEETVEENPEDLVKEEETVTEEAVKEEEIQEAEPAADTEEAVKEEVSEPAEDKAEFEPETDNKGIYNEEIDIKLDDKDNTFLQNIAKLKKNIVSDSKYGINDLDVSLRDTGAFIYDNKREHEDYDDTTIRDLPKYNFCCNFP